jgi:hypothetical protein
MHLEACGVDDDQARVDYENGRTRGLDGARQSDNPYPDGKPGHAGWEAGRMATTFQPMNEEEIRQIADYGEANGCIGYHSAKRLMAQIKHLAEAVEHAHQKIDSYRWTETLDRELEDQIKKWKHLTESDEHGDRLHHFGCGHGLCPCPADGYLGDDWLIANLLNTLPSTPKSDSTASTTYENQKAEAK